MLKNVSEFESVEDASKSIISTLQAYNIAVDDSMTIVDKFNRVGNEFSVSSDGIATALQGSASALMSANNDLESSIALVAAANRVVQDESEVGAALRTISLRLRGTSVSELEELGEDTEGAVESVSKLQSKIMGLTGVNILNDDGSYKSTYEILLAISEVYSTLDDQSKAATLELIAGKNRSNVASALLTNQKDLVAAYEAASNAEGSAAKELSTYLDSIEGRVSQFNNAVQSMWSNTLDSDVVKWFVEMGTELIKIVDKIGLLGTALAGVFVYLTAFKQQTPLALLQQLWGIITNIGASIKANGFGRWIGSLLGVVPAMKAVTVETVANTVATQMNDAAKAKQMMSEMGLATATGTLSLAQREQASTAILNAMSTGQLTMAQGNAMLAMLGYSSATMAADGSLKVLDATTKSFMATNPVGWILLAASAIAMVVFGLSQIPSKAEKLQEELQDLQSELQDVKSELDSVNSELETTEERIAELLAKDSLSFVEQEELENLQKQNAELQRQLDLLEAKDKRTKSKLAKTFNETMDEDVNSDYRIVSEYDFAGNSKDIGWTGKDKGWSAWWRKMFLGDAYTQEEMSGKEYIDELLERHQSYREELADVEQQIIDAGDDAKEVKKLEKRKEKIESEMGDITTIIDEKTTSWETAAEGLDYGIDDETDAWLDYINNTRDKIEIGLGSDNATTNAITRIFNKDEYSTVSDSIDEYVEALKKGDESAKDKIDNIIRNNEDLVADLQESGVKINDEINEAANYFVDFASDANYATVEGKIKEMAEATSRLSTALSGDFDTTNLDQVKQALADKGWVDTDGNLMSDAIAEYFGGEDGGISSETQAEIERLVQQIYDGEISVKNALKQFELFGIESTLDIQIKEVQTNFKDVFVDLEDADGLINTFEELGEAIGSTVGALDALNKAQGEMDYSGRVSIQTALELMQYTDNYADVLEVVDGKLQLNKNAEENLINARITAMKVSAQTALADAQAAYEKAKLATQTYNDALTTDMSASVVASAWEKVLAAGAGLVEGIKSLFTEESWTEAYNRAYNETLSNMTGYETTYDDAGLQALVDAQAEAEQAVKNAQGNVDLLGEINADNIKEMYESDDIEDPEDAAKTKLEEKMEELQREMDYWENRIGANQSKYEQLQNEIGLLEAKGQKANAEYYQGQIDLENERLWLLGKQKDEAQMYLDTLTEGSEEWWEVANVLNDIESELDDVTASIVDLQDAMAEVDWYKFEEFNNRIGNITSQLETMRDLLAPNGEEDWFDETGGWTEKGAAVLGTYLNDLQTFQEGFANATAELENYEPSYAGNEAYYETIGIHSEQEYYDKVQELTEQQHNYAQSISDTEQSVVDMYESNINAVEEYTETLIDSYNDYIDSVKEALSAERD